MTDVNHEVPSDEMLIAIESVAARVRSLIGLHACDTRAMADALARELIYEGHWDWLLLDFIDIMHKRRKDYRKHYKQWSGSRVPKRDYSWLKTADFEVTYDAARWPE